MRELVEGLRYSASHPIIRILISYLAVVAVFAAASETFSRRNIFKRDHFACQYCGARKSARDLTIEHVIPQSRGGKTEWTNVVTACRPCNNKKGSKMASISGMGGRASIKKSSMQKDWQSVIKSGIEVLKLNPWDVSTLQALATGCEELELFDAQLVFLRWALVEVTRSACRASDASWGRKV